MASNIHISASAEPFLELFGFTLTNSMFMSLIVTLVLITLAVIIRLSIKMVPSKVQSISELTLGFFYQLGDEVAGDTSRKFMPFVLTSFLYILLNNWFGLLPIVHDINLKSAAADLNATLGLTIVVIVLTHYFGFTHAGILNHASKFINFSSPIKFFVGILELIAEIAKVLSLSLRLYGNVFAGSVLLAVIISLVPLFVPIPFLGLEVFIGFIQAAVFSILTLVFMGMAVEKAH